MLLDHPFLISEAYEDIAALDAVSALPKEYPGWMFERQGAGRVPEPKA